MITAVINLLPIIFFSFLAFWKYNAVVFMVTAGASLMLGLYWFDAFTIDVGLGVSLMLIAYSFVCVGFAFACIFKRERNIDD